MLGCGGLTSISFSSFSVFSTFSSTYRSTIKNKGKKGDACISDTWFLPVGLTVSWAHPGSLAHLDVDNRRHILALQAHGLDSGLGVGGGSFEKGDLLCEGWALPEPEIPLPI